MQGFPAGIDTGLFDVQVSQAADDDQQATAHGQQRQEDPGLPDVKVQYRRQPLHQYPEHETVQQIRAVADFPQPADAAWSQGAEQGIAGRHDHKEQ
ncbi:hypothetical protein D3C87_1918510 [compost metagenome]